MEQSQLIELIKTLSPEEKSHLLGFASLNYFNSSRSKKHIVPLLSLCVELPLHEPDFHLDKHEFYKQIFGDQAFVDGKLDKIMVDAQKVVRAFLITQRYFRPENEFQRQMDFAEEVRLRGLNNRHKNLMERIRLYQQNYPYRDVKYFFNQFQFETSVHYVESIFNSQKDDLNIPNVLHATETYYYIRRVALLSRYLLQLVLAKLHIPDFIQEHINTLEVPQRCLDASPQLSINYQIFKGLKRGFLEMPEINALFEVLKKHEKEMDREAVQEMYTHLRNFAVLLAHQDRRNLEIHHTLHEIHLLNLEQGLLLYEGKLSWSRYLGIVDNALKINKIEWANEFIETYKDRLFGDQNAKEVYKLMKAQYYFSIGEFDQCLSILPDSFQHLDLLLWCRRIELKALFELQSDLFSFKLDAFKMFLSRTSPKLLSENQHRMNLDFLNMLFQLFASIPGDKTRADTLSKRLNDKKLAAEWLWLSKKVKALYP
ncbi:MAG: hypothetical protein JNJ57_06715 [Saprospiraceae bacterium]|nr:hypothetical protein [Saprospiraceae bacterium]